MRAADFDYELPAGAIAQRPAPRGESRLLALEATGAARHRSIADLPSLLVPGDLVVVNDTRVIPARLFARRVASGGEIELLLIERVTGCDWWALVRPARKVPAGARLRLADGLPAEVLAAGGAGRRLVRFAEPVEPHLATIGHLPLPPYIRRPDDDADRAAYQTIFAREPGAVAAPTAGLHFTPELVAALARLRVGLAPLTLHVGIGTFKPLTAERVEDHRMEPERYEVPAATAAAIGGVRAGGGRIVAVGTTVVRALESAALAGGGEVLAGAATTRLFITPGFPFQVVDLLLTNFHLPRSTLLLLVAAFAGRERVLAAYREAVAAGYRFYSYGDAMLAARRTSR